MERDASEGGSRLDVILYQIVERCRRCGRDTREFHGSRQHWDFDGGADVVTEVDVARESRGHTNAA